MEKRIGIVGFGEMGKRHAQEFREATCGKITVAGVVEPDDLKYREGCEWNQFNVPRYNNIAELLAKEDPDGLLIVSPNFRHYENLQELTNYHKPILLEKPLDASLENIVKIVRWAQEHKGIILVDHVMRYAPIIQEAKQMISSGAIGKVCSFEFSQRMDAGAMYHTFRRSIAKGGGHMIEKATHDLDVALFLTGAKPEKVIMTSRQQLYGGNRPNDLCCSDCADSLSCDSAHHFHHTGTNDAKDVDVSNDLCVFAKEVDVPDNESCLIQCQDGIFGSYSHNYFTHQPGRARCYEIIGTKGAIFIEMSVLPEHHGVIHYFPRQHRGKTDIRKFHYFDKIHYNGGPYVARHFYNLMTGTETCPNTTVEQAFIAEILGLAAMRSAGEERYVKLAEIIPDDLKELLK
jgi:predicted dehydrogenase